jgi:hypothetical protein
VETHADHTVLIRQILAGTSGFEVRVAAAGEGPDRLGFSPDRERVSSVVLAGDTALELGAPGRLSVSRALWTRQRGLVSDRLYVHGDAVAAMKGRSVSLLLLVLMELPDGLDPLEGPVASPMNLTHRLPHVMTRSLPGRLWIRVHKKVIDNFSLINLGRTVRAAYAHKFPGIENLDVMIAADDDDFIRGFEGPARAAGVLSGEMRKLRWEASGEISCSDLDCRVCDEKPVCDTIRDVLTFRRRQ